MKNIRLKIYQSISMHLRLLKSLQSIDLTLLVFHLYPYREFTVYYTIMFEVDHSTPQNQKILDGIVCGFNPAMKSVSINSFCNDFKMCPSLNTQIKGIH